MCWRQVSKFQKTVFVVIFYTIVYVFIQIALAPEPIYNFVSDDFRIGDKYAFVFVVAAKTPAFTDAEGSDVFKKCDNKLCFMTNNKGFLPMREYDAVVMYGNRSLLENSAIMEPEKKYLIEATDECLTKKFIGCSGEPKITSYLDREGFELCSLCMRLHQRRTKKGWGFVAV